MREQATVNVFFEAPDILNSIVLLLPSPWRSGWIAQYNPLLTSSSPLYAKEAETETCGSRLKRLQDTLMKSFVSVLQWKSLWGLVLTFGFNNRTNHSLEYQTHAAGSLLRSHLLQSKKTKCFINKPLYFWIESRYDLGGSHLHIIFMCKMKSDQITTLVPCVCETSCFCEQNV